MNLMDVKSLRHVYAGGTVALDGISLTIQQGVRLAIVGANGAGKTTLLLHLNGLLRPSGGEILMDGYKVGYSAKELMEWRKRVGLVLQEPDDQLFASTVYEDVSFGPLNLGLTKKEATQRVDHALVAMGIVHLAQRPPHLLSFGQKKRVAIAGAIAMQPKILVLDEPTAGLDHRGSLSLLEALEQLEAQGTTLIFSTHDVDMAYAFAHQVAVFHAGKVLSQGDATEIFMDSNLMEQAELGIPLALEIGLTAQAKGIFPSTERLPRDRKDILSLIDRLEY
jgi:cobalt/nickel transport system ATP-binding protein